MRNYTTAAALLLIMISLILSPRPTCSTNSAQKPEQINTNKNSNNISEAVASPPPSPVSRVAASGDFDDDEDTEDDDEPVNLPFPNAFVNPTPVVPPTPAPVPMATVSQQETTSPATQALLDLWHLVVSYKIIDISAIILLVVVVIVAIQGKGKNMDVATNWMQTIREALSVQFAAVSVHTKGALTARSYSSFDLFCSGRRNCMFMHATLECVPRHCAWRGHILRQLLGHTGDLVTLEFVLPMAGEGMVLNICRRPEQRSYIENSWDIMEFCKVRHASSVTNLLPEGFVMHADTLEAAEKFLDLPGFHKHLVQLAPYLRNIYTSDLCTNTNPALSATIAAALGTAAAGPTKPKRVLRMSYYLPEDNVQFDHRLPIVVGCKLVDALANIRLSDPTREVVKKMRMAYEKEQQKHRRKEQQEAAEKRKIEKRKEQERALENLPEEQRRKAQEAQERRALREQRKEQRHGIRMIRA